MTDAVIDPVEMVLAFSLYSQTVYTGTISGNPPASRISASML